MESDTENSPSQAIDFTGGFVYTDGEPDYIKTAQFSKIIIILPTIGGTQELCLRRVARAQPK